MYQKAGMTAHGKFSIFVRVQVHHRFQSHRFLIKIYLSWISISPSSSIDHGPKGGQMPNLVILVILVILVTLDTKFTFGLPPHHGLQEG
jgi:hypothetical protein